MTALISFRTGLLQSRGPVQDRLQEQRLSMIIDMISIWPAGLHEELQLQHRELSSSIHYMYMRDIHWQKSVPALARIYGLGKTSEAINQAPSF